MSPTPTNPIFSFIVPLLPHGSRRLRPENSRSERRKFPCPAQTPQVLPRRSGRTRLEQVRAAVLRRSIGRRVVRTRQEAKAYMTDHRPPVDGLQLRLRDARDSADLLELFNQERFLRYASARGPFAATSDLETWLANIACANRVEVVGVVDSKAIGFGGLYVMGDGLGHSGWVLLGVNETRQGRGVGARVLQLLLAAASVMIGLRRVQLTV